MDSVVRAVFDMAIINAQSVINGGICLDSNKRKESVIVPACVIYSIEISSEIKCTMEIKLKTSNKLVCSYHIQSGFQEISWRGHGIHFNEDIEISFYSIYLSDGAVNYRIFSEDLYSAYSQQFDQELDKELRK